MYTLKRIKFHTMRFRGEIIYSSAIIASLMAMIAVAFPKDSAGISEYFNLISEVGMDALLTTIDADAPGWLFWVSLMAGAYLYFVSVIAGIRIGTKLFPSNEKSALELIASSPKRARTFYLENILAAVVAIILILLPSFIILAIYSLTQDAPDTIPRLAALFTLAGVVTLFFVAFTSLFSTWRFSQGSGMKIGFFYLIYAFLIEIAAGSLPEYEDFRNVSVNSYIAPSAGLLDGEHNWTEMWVVLGLIIAIFALSYWLIKRPDYIEKVSAPKKNRLTFLPKFAPSGKLATKYPLLFDQFRKDRTFFFLWTGIVNIAFLYIIVIFDIAIADNPEMLVTMVQSFGPMMDAFTFGYAVEPTFFGFLTFEVFGLTWLYFGVFCFIPAINIPNRDQANDEQDMIWANSITPEKVINYRTAALSIFFTIYFWISYLVLSGLSIAYEMENDALALFHAFGVGYFYFLALILFFVGLTMILPLHKGKKYVMWFYIISIILMITAFMVPEIDGAKYLSIAYYYDPVGLVLNKVEVGTQYLISLGFLAISAMIYVFSLKKRYRCYDLLT
ncbi:MAG: hypothetical protein INQ03_21530 [Candidatus Heimdallarchaeota archaeon]|nr:hypothetical protein [Candidatus Heimdallarchaeota archaeon]